MIGFVYPVGTRVMLASGGPVMLVVDVDPKNSRVLVSWRNADGVMEEWFPSVCLDIVRARVSR